MVSDQEDLDLLLSLCDDRVMETPPGSPSAAPGYLTDDESPKRRANADMSEFRSVVQDFIDYDPKPVSKTSKSKGSNNSNINDVEKFSGLRIRNQLLSPAEISDRFSEIRFVRLPTIKNLLMGDKLSGCWATMGVLLEKGQPKTSSIGQLYGIWKIGSLDENSVSLFLFGDAYQKTQSEKAGTVFGLFNCSVRKDKMKREFSLSVNSGGQLVKLGVSADYGVCTAKRKDGTPCTSVVNKRQGAFCKIHKLNASEKFATKRTELKGGNLRTAFRDLKSQGIYTVESGPKKATQPVRILSVEGLRKALSTADKVTPNANSQGIRFLNEMAKQTALKNLSKKPEAVNKQTSCVEKRKESMTQETQRQVELESKKKRRENSRDTVETSKVAAGKMMVLDFCSSDDE